MEYNERSEGFHNGDVELKRSQLTWVSSKSWVPKSSSGIVEVPSVVVAVVGDQHFSILVGPEAVEVDEDAGDGVALATVYQVLEGDLVGVFGLHHVKDLILGTGQWGYWWVSKPKQRGSICVCVHNIPWHPGRWPAPDHGVSSAPEWPENTTVSPSSYTDASWARALERDLPWRSSWGKRRWGVPDCPCPEVWKYTATLQAPSGSPRPIQSLDRSCSP